MFDQVIHVIGELRVLNAMGLIALSFILPLTIFIGRSNIKTVRRKIIADLESVFRIEGREHDQLIPSFEFAAYKCRALPQGPDNTQPSEWRAYSFPVLVFIMVSFSGFLTSSGMLLGSAGHRRGSACSAPAPDLAEHRAEADLRPAAGEQRPCAAERRAAAAESCSGRGYAGQDADLGCERPGAEPAPVRKAVPAE